MHAFFGENGMSVFGVVVDAAVKGAVILGASELLLLLWRKHSAATRHAMRLAALITMALVPLLALTIPPARAPIWPITTRRFAGNDLDLIFRLPRNQSSRHESGAPTQPLASHAVAQKSVASAAHSVRISASTMRSLEILWVAGIVVCCVPIGLGWMQRRRLLNGAKFLSDGEWRDLLVDCCERLGVRRVVRLFESDYASAPVTWGTISPVIIIPASAWTWSAERRRVVLLHELGHVRRRDYFTQYFAQIVSALFWFNPLVWRAAAAMRRDREQACDDLVLESGCKASEYATHLLEIATGLRGATIGGAIAMARPSGLEERVAAALDFSRSRRAPGVGIWAATGFLTAAIAITMAAQRPGAPAENDHLRQEQKARLRKFAAEKEQQAEALASRSNEKILPVYQEFFTAAKKGESQTVTNLYEDFKRRHQQYNASGDLPHTSYWSTILEISLAYFDVAWGEPDHVQLGIDGFMKSVLDGSIYLGGTDPGRGLPTAFSTNHAKGDPFFTITQNALADTSYLDYVRSMYGEKLYIPTADDSAAVFKAYVEDATERLRTGKLKPGENVTTDKDGRVSVSGQVAVMEVNARLAKILFDKNPDREFYIEESFPLEWMYPHLTPAGQVMKIERKPVERISGAVINSDTNYWTQRIDKLLGTRISIDGTGTDFARQIELMWVARTSKVDPRFLKSDWAQRAFSKWRSGIAGVYSWRVSHAPDAAERAQMARVAEFAFRQSYVLCPYSPEAVFRYVDFLTKENRTEDAKRIVRTSLKVSPDNQPFQGLLASLEKPSK